MTFILQGGFGSICKICAKVPCFGQFGCDEKAFALYNYLDSLIVML
jgi:hypothetical protein